MNIVKICESNYQSYLNLEIVAFSFAYEGAMGEPGSIYIIDKAGQIYNANYCWADNCIERDHIKDIIPVFEDLGFGIMGCESYNDNWDAVYLGYGNTLLMTKDIIDGFNKKVEEAKYEHSGELFQHWPGIVLGLIGKFNSDLTINDIWDLKSK